MKVFLSVEDIPSFIPSMNNSVSFIDCTNKVFGAIFEATLFQRCFHISIQVYIYDNNGEIQTCLDFPAVQLRMVKISQCRKQL